MSLLKGSRAVAACTINSDSTMIAVADKHNDHNVFVFDIEYGSLMMQDKGGPDEIFDIAFSK